jgi:hypothetical protein
MPVAEVVDANTLITWIGRTTPAGTALNVTSSPPAVKTLIIPPDPEYSTHGHVSVGYPTYGMFTVSLVVTAAALLCCNF